MAQALILQCEIALQDCRTRRESWPRVSTLLEWERSTRFLKIALGSRSVLTHPHPCVKGLQNERQGMDNAVSNPSWDGRGLLQSDFQ